MNPITYQLFLLQLENYEIGRYWSLLFRKGYFFPNSPMRQKIVWTSKAKLVLIFSFLLFIPVLSLIDFIFKSEIIFIITIIILFILLPLLYTISTLIVWPIDFILKYRVVKKAKQKIRKCHNLIIIGIAGSYGKTTMKQVVETTLRESQNVLATPDSVNTLVGIASWLNKNLSEKNDVLIIEMGEHYRGDIKDLCRLTPPDIAIVTGINEAHFERLGSLENAIDTIFEISEYSKEGALIVLNADDSNIQKNYHKYTNHKELKFYSSGDNPLTEIKIINKKFNADNLEWEIDFGDFGKINTPILGGYVAGVFMANIIICHKIGLSTNQIKHGLSKSKPVKHRLEPIISNKDVLVIDDSYNGNPAGVNEAIKTLSEFKNKRKLYLTPGLVEVGSQNRNLHINIGRKLAKVADIIILIKNDATKYIAEGLIESNYRKENILWYDDAESAHTDLPNILKPGDVILFQNDLGDQYV